MVSAAPIVGVLALLFGSMYRFSVQPYLHDNLGIGRAVESINNQHCERVPELEACEDAWYHQPTGLLYLSCGRVATKWTWLPNADHLDAANAPTDEYIAILDTRKSGPWSTRITKVQPMGFAGHDGQGSLLLHGIGAFLGGDGIGDSDVLRLFLINHRPQADAELLGANSTVEVFETKLGSDTMQHIRTFADPVIVTPNNLVAVAKDAFYFSNDHSVKTGWRKQLDFIRAGSALGYCDAATGCKPVSDKLMYPNGMAGALNWPSRDASTVYQASSGEPFVQILQSAVDHTLQRADRIKTGYVMDNLNMAADGSLTAAAFPKALPLISLMSKGQQTSEVAPAAVLRIRRDASDEVGTWAVEKLFEDDGHVVSAATSAILDTERNVLFLSGILTPYVAVCQLPLS